MIKEYRKKTNLWIATGFLFPILVVYFAGELGRILPEIVVSYITLFSVFLGWLSYIVGCVYYAKAKGRHPLWGLLGMTGVGLIILVLLPDNTVAKNKSEEGTIEGALGE